MTYSNPLGPISPARSALVLGIIAACCALAMPAFAYVVGIKDDAIIVAAPASVHPGANTASIEFFNEQQDVELLFDLIVDAVPGAAYQSLADLSGSQQVIPAGTCLRSHYGHLSSAVSLDLIGRAKFNRDILGVMITQPGLDATNFLGAPATDYPYWNDGCANPGHAHCGMVEPGSSDRIEVDNRNIRLQMEASFPGDRVRVITEGDCP